MKKNNFSKSEKANYSNFLNNFFPYILLIAFSIIPLFAFFHPGLPITHDGKDHVARIANFYESLQEGVLIPRWAANLNWGYGHPILMFLYPLPSYAGAFFHFLGFSYVDSVKAVFILAYISSSITMYLWASKTLNKLSGFVASILYLFAPYRFVDIQVRGAYGEHVAFIFPPLVLLFLYLLFQKRRFFYSILTGIALSSLILAHNAISLMFLPVFGLYGCYLLVQAKERKKPFLYACVAVVIGFALAAFFWIPALLEGKYTLRDIVTINEYAKHFVNFSEFIYAPWSFGGTQSLSKQVGIPQWLSVFACLVLSIQWYKKRNSLWILAAGSIFIFLASLFVMTSPSKFLADHVKIIEDFQFPWRFLSVVVFITAFCGGLTVYSLSQNKQKIIAALLIVSSILLTAGYWSVNGYLYKPDSFYSGIYEGTTDTGESAPIWSVRFMEKRPKAPMEVIEGKAKILQTQRKTTAHTYTVIADEKTRLRENTLYFPGWHVYVDNMEVLPEFQDPKNRGLMTFYVEKGTHTVQILFTNTKIRTVANAISLITLVIVGLFCIMRILSIWKRFQ